MTRELTRKELFRELFGGRREAKAEPSALLRPPGALDPDALYLAACSGCAACVPACPHGAIFMLDMRDDPPARVAVVSPGRHPCHLCPDLPCIPTCPDGALTALPAVRAVRMGVAQVDPRRCRTFRGEPCDLCLRACPLAGEAIKVIGGKPVVFPTACVGCGLCEAACPERLKAITVYPERELVPGLRIPRLLRGTPAG